MLRGEAGFTIISIRYITYIQLNSGNCVLKIRANEVMHQQEISAQAPEQGRKHLLPSPGPTRGLPTSDTINLTNQGNVNKKCFQCYNKITSQG
jgi:hypothetical protein